MTQEPNKPNLSRIQIVAGVLGIMFALWYCSGGAKSASEKAVDKCYADMKERIGSGNADPNYLLNTCRQMCEVGTLEGCR